MFIVYISHNKPKRIKPNQNITKFINFYSSNFWIILFSSSVKLIVSVRFLYKFQIVAETSVRFNISSFFNMGRYRITKSYDCWTMSHRNLYTQICAHELAHVCKCISSKTKTEIGSIKAIISSLCVCRCVITHATTKQQSYGSCKIILNLNDMRESTQFWLIRWRYCCCCFSNGTISM